MHALFLASLALVLLGAGCAMPPVAELPTTPPAAEPPPIVEAPPAEVPIPPAAPAPPEPQDARRPYYIAFTSEQFVKAQAEKRPILLYFWAAWCPICRVEEPGIIAAVESMNAPVAGFRVNFDTESAMKRSFDVGYQHTTIILNARGEEMSRFFGPVSEAELRDALRAAAR
jgi:thiol-disulfide isomerase/thioredoxin